MNQNTCLYCNDTFIGKRSDAKFCTSTCKAKYWEERKANDKQNLPVKLSDGLRGIVGDKPTTIQKEEAPKFYTKEIQVETKEYKLTKTKLDAFQTSISRLSKERTTLVEQAKEIAKRNGDIYYFSGVTAGALIADKDFKDRQKVLMGAGLGLVAGFIMDKMFVSVREKNKQEDIKEIVGKVRQIDVKLTSDLQIANVVSSNLQTISRYEKQTLKLTVPSFDFSNVFTNWPDKQPHLLPEAKPIKEATMIEKKVVALPAPAKSEKVISSRELHNMDYTALDFKGKWNILFGYPSANFHCVLTGMSGEGKSTFAIQFASYLAENFGRVLYISGEEGFSKTFKDKFTNNNAVSEDLYVADLRSYDGIVNEIAPDTYHFIFIDSLDNMRIDAERMKLLRERYKESALITISQSTKDGKMRGSYEIVHDCDMAIKVEKGIATTTKNRFKEKGMEMRVFGD